MKNNLILNNNNFLKNIEENVCIAVHIKRKRLVSNYTCFRKNSEE